MILLIIKQNKDLLPSLKRKNTKKIARVTEVFQKMKKK